MAGLPANVQKTSPVELSADQLERVTGGAVNVFIDPDGDEAIKVVGSPGNGGNGQGNDGIHFHLNP